ncbi:MAG: tetratricopeptide repeat protein [Chromatiales bacterium]
MKLVCKTVTNLIIVTLLIFSQTGVASTDNATELSGIAEAKKLYAEALPMEIDSPRRAEILNQAASILKNVIRQHPQSMDAHRKLMGVYLLMQDYSNAISTMQDAITLSPEDPKLFISLAFLYEHSGAFELAKGMLGQALKLDPNNKIAQDYKLVIQQKIDQQNLAHQGQAMMGESHGKQVSPHHGQTASGSKLIDSKMMESKTSNNDAAK